MIAQTKSLSANYIKAKICKRYKIANLVYVERRLVGCFGFIAYQPL